MTIFFTQSLDAPQLALNQAAFIRISRKAFAFHPLHRSILLYNKVVCCEKGRSV